MLQMCNSQEGAWSSIGSDLAELYLKREKANVKREKVKLRSQMVNVREKVFPFHVSPLPFHLERNNDVPDKTN